MKYLLVAAIAFLSGCSWIGISEAQRNLEKGSSELSIIPEELDQPNFGDPMPIPDIIDYRGLGDQLVDVSLPQSLTSSFGVEQIVIRRLGEDRWVFLDLPTATIWPQVVLFWEEHHLPLANLDPRNGTLETEWLVGAAGDADAIFDSLKSGSAWSIQSSAQQYKFRVRVEPGVRTGSTELYLEAKGMPLGAPYRLDRVEWTGKSDDPDLEAKLLSEIAYYLGGRTAEGPTVSLLAAGLQESKATLDPQPTGMVLKYRLNFNRAWATVGAALEDASVEVEDLDRSSADYFVHYTSAHDPDPGFFTRLFTREKDDGTSGQRFKVHLEPLGEEVHVTVAIDDTTTTSTNTMNLLLSERLLKLIKEYST